MTRKIFTILILVVLFTPGYSQSSEIKYFWTEFKNAVVIRDTVKLTSMIEFSVTNGLIGKDKSEFYHNFNSLFDDKTVEIMTKTENLGSVCYLLI